MQQQETVFKNQVLKRIALRQVSGNGEIPAAGQRCWPGQTWAEGGLDSREEPAPCRGAGD